MPTLTALRRRTLTAVGAISVVVALFFVGAGDDSDRASRDSGSSGATLRRV
jgi:hypothetical protein